jgi:adenylyltransferase/sulfurtransferase
LEKQALTKKQGLAVISATKTKTEKIKKMDTKLDPKLDRYQRQIIIDDFGIKGQEKLKKARAFIAGAGGLGGIIAIYLAAAGVGKIGLFDNDLIELTNLNRQILYGNRYIGMQKVEVAKEKIEELNPEIKVEAIRETITKNNAHYLVEDYDFIVDAMDNFPTRYILNNVAISRNIPFFHGAIRGFEGRVSTIIPGRTPCFKCIYPKYPPPEIIPVIGVTPAVVGSLQATEVIKYIVGIGNLLMGKMLIYDGLRMEFMIMELQKIKDCPECKHLTADTP